MLSKAPHILIALAREAVRKTNQFIVLATPVDERTRLWNTDQVETWRNGKK